MNKIFAALLALLIAPAVHAQVFKIPSECVHTMTVQERACTLRHIYDCNDFERGSQLVQRYSKEGKGNATLIDRNGNWLTTQFKGSSTSILDRKKSKKLMSLNALFTFGQARVDVVMNYFGRPRVHAKGVDKLTGRKTTIDGVVLHETYVDVSFTDLNNGRVYHQTRGNEYVSKKYRMFFGKNVKTTAYGVAKVIKNPPVDFIFSGEAGFTSTKPKYNCAR